MRSDSSQSSCSIWTSIQTAFTRPGSSLMASMLLGTLVLGMNFGYAPVAQAAQDAIFCPADRLNSNGNICTANDVELATAVVGSTQTGAVCSPGETFLVEIAGTLTVRTERSDIGVWIATDGKPIKPRGGTNGAPDEGGSQSCEVMELTGPHAPTPESIGDTWLVYDFEPQGDCKDVSPVTNLDTSEGVQLTSQGDSIIGGAFDINNDGVIDANDDDPGVVDLVLDTGQIAWYKVIDGEIDIDQDGDVDADDDGFWPGAVVGVQSYAVIDGRIDVNNDGIIDGTDNDARAFNDAVTLTCVPGPDGGILLSSLVSWIQPGGAGDICDSTDPDTYPLQSSKCSTNEVSLDVDVVGKVTVVKNAPAAEVGDLFGFIYTNSQVTNADSDAGIPDISVTSPFSLAHTESADIYTVLGNPDTVNGGFLPGVVQITENNLPTGWELASIQCVDTENPENDISGLVNVNLNQDTVTVTMNYNEANPTATIDDITCTFNNQPEPARLTVVKNSAGGDGTFDFNWGSTTNGVDNQFQLTTSSGQASTVIEITTGLGDTDFFVSESLGTGWEFASATCLDTDTETPVGTANNAAPLHAIEGFTLDAGSNVTCTFNNQAQGTITINKATVGGDGTFNFSAPGLVAPPFNITTTGGNGSTGAINNVSPGTYTVTETDPQVTPGGWDLTNLVCNDSTENSSVDIPNRVATIEVDPGDTISCTFTNTKRGTAIVEKQTLPDGSEDTFSFTGDIAGGPIGDGESFTVSNLVPGLSYSSTEIVPEGWALTSIVCDDGNSTGDVETATATFNIEAGEVVRCVFTNTNYGSITVVKDITATGPVSQTFSFSGTGVGGFDFGGGFTLTPTDADTPDSTSFQDLPPGAYSLAEANPISSGWQLTNAICSNGNNPSNITLAAGVDLTCTFTNAPLGSSTITKNSVGGTGLFGFTWDNNVPEGEASTFDLDTTGDNTESRDFSYKLIPLTQYDLSETSVPADVGPYNQGWVQTSVGCQDPTEDSVAPNGTDGASIIASSGETVNCTFTNTLDGTLIVRKETIPDGIDVAFSFAGDADLTGDIRDFSAFAEELVLTAQPGTYGTVETVPNGWALTNINCTGGDNSTVRIGSEDVFTSPGFDAGDDQIEVDLAAGDTVVCTFTNTLQGGITINKVVEGADASFNFNATYDVDGFTLSNGQSNSSQPLQSGSYTITESLPGGYALTDISCPGEYASSIVTSVNGVEIGLVNGEQVECTFTNTELGSITIEKQTLPDGSPQSFSFSGAISTSLTDGGSASLGGILPGQYTATEAALAGWDLTDITCTGDDNSSGDTGTRTATFNIEAGDDVTCVFTNTQRANIILDKTVVVDDGGTATQADFQAYIDGSPADWDTSYEVLPNVQYTASEDEAFGYAASDWGGDCAANGTVTPLPGQTVTCTITNDDIAPTLSLVKSVITDDGGTAVAADWLLLADDGDENEYSGDGGFALQDVMVGSYLLSESGGPAGYTASDWVCTGTGDQTEANEIVLTEGQTATCTITNDDVAPTLALVKTVTVDDGGTAVATDWSLLADGGNAGSHSGDGGFVLQDVMVGTYALSESGGPDGYTAGDWSCTGTGSQNGASIALTEGQTATCTINNDDIAPTLSLVKTVTVDDGGTAVPANWSLLADGGDAGSHSGDGGFVLQDVMVGTYALSESGGPSGYTAGDWSCTGTGSQEGASISLTEGQTATCTINNDDIAPSLTLVKEVVADDGGTAVAADWLLSATGPTPISGQGGVSSDVNVGDYALSESGGPSGYAASDWVCTGTGSQTGASINLTEGESATCTITNDDIAPTLSLVKTVTVDDGGTAVATDWALLADGGDAGSHSGDGGFALQNVMVGTYALSESGGPGGYTASDWSCTGTGSQDGASINLTEGETATCTINNDDIAPSLTLVKEVVTDDGGTAVPSDWLLSASGPTPISGQGGVSSDVNVGDYSLSESGGPDGYAASNWVCTGTGSQNGASVNLTEGESAVCTITNDDIRPILTIVKQVSNIPDGEFCFQFISGDFNEGFCIITEEMEGSEGGTLPAGNYSVVEVDGPYTLLSQSCDNGDSPEDLTLNVGDDVTCTFVNGSVENVPVNNPVALLLLILMTLATGWYFRPAAYRRF